MPFARAEAGVAGPAHSAVGHRGSCNAVIPVPKALADAENGPNSVPVHTNGTSSFYSSRKEISSRGQYFSSVSYASHCVGQAG